MLSLSELFHAVAILMGGCTLLENGSMGIVLQIYCRRVLKHLTGNSLALSVSSSKMLEYSFPMGISVCCLVYSHIDERRVVQPETSTTGEQNKEKT